MGSLVTNVLILTAWSFGATTVGLMVLGAVERRSPFAPLNAISHMFYRSEAYGVDTPTAKFLIPGVALNLAAMAGWGLLLELSYRSLHVTPANVGLTVLLAIAMTVVAYVVDYHVVPKRFTPGFEYVLSIRALFGTYVILAMSLAAGGLCRVGGS